MGQHANQRAWLEFERKQRKEQGEYFEQEPPITESELAEIASDAHWERVDYPRTNRQWGWV
jgi:hypothetical protein